MNTTRHATPGRAALRPLVGDLRQLACVRRIVLDDGPERGVRALSFSTGGGLDFWVLTDRSFDIGPLWWRGTPLAWQSPNGFTAPALHPADSDAGHGFERGFSGFLVTCGLDHVRRPDGPHPLHGRLPFTPGRLSAYGEDWHAGEPVLFCEGEVTQASLNGERLRLHRRIEAPIGGAVVRVLDEVENLDACDQPLALLYHINFGFPLIGTGTALSWQGKNLALTSDPAASEPTVTCVPAMRREVQRCIVSRPAHAAWPGVSATVSFDPSTLPWLQIWWDPRPHRHVLGIEPTTSARRADGSSEPGSTLAAGAMRKTGIAIAFDGCGEAMATRRGHAMEPSMPDL